MLDVAILSLSTWHQVLQVVTTESSSVTDSIVSLLNESKNDSHCCAWYWARISSRSSVPVLSGAVLSILWATSGVQHGNKVQQVRSNIVRQGGQHWNVAYTRWKDCKSSPCWLIHQESIDDHDTQSGQRTWHVPPCIHPDRLETIIDLLQKSFHTSGLEDGSFAYVR
jgi:hypothetical protein